MDQTNHRTQPHQYRKHDCHIDEHDNERIRCHRMSHTSHLSFFAKGACRGVVLPRASTLCSAAPHPTVGIRHLSFLEYCRYVRLLYAYPAIQVYFIPYWY